MTQTIVTRGGQITLNKEIRDKLKIKEGDTIQINTQGNIVLISKKNPKIFENHDFLPSNFNKILNQIRKFSYEDKLKKLGIIE